MAVSVNLVLNDRVIAGMTAIPVKGIVAGYVQKFAREVKDEAIVVTVETTGHNPRGFSRSGSMARAWTVRPIAYGPETTVFSVRNTRPYAAFVFRGTGPIIVKGKKLMPVGKTQVVGIRKGKISDQLFFAARTTGKMPMRRKVRGQTANNIPMKAVKAVMLRRGL